MNTDALSRWREVEADLEAAWRLWLESSGRERAHARLDFGSALSDEADAARSLQDDIEDRPEA